MIQLDLLSLRFGRDLRKTPPLGPLSLMASARRAGFECRLIDGQFASELGPFRAESLAELLTSLDAPVLGISLFNDAIPVLIAALDLAGKSLTDRRILVGGPGVVGIAAPLLERLPQVEAVVVGEGETALSQLLANPRGAVGRAGVFQRDEQGRIFGHGRSPHENLDALAEPDWNWCRGKPYARIPFSTMRGCPYDCSFCEVTAFMGRDVSKRRLASA
ncbi:MAG TPA: cobalamin-dependent protein, partial [Pirellulaceae bacterium]|nr:cobalamin-dependent protein [Pirellulaceae bacterium]